MSRFPSCMFIIVLSTFHFPAAQEKTLSHRPADDCDNGTFRMGNDIFHMRWECVCYWCDSSHHVGRVHRDGTVFPDAILAVGNFHYGAQSGGSFVAVLRRHQYGRRRCLLRTKCEQRSESYHLLDEALAIRPHTNTVWYKKCSLIFCKFKIKFSFCTIR